ncbi:hypothetical protein GIB67_041122, partial [Kingdonia uniflora]
DVWGNDVDLSTYKGKVLLVFNIASQWAILDFRLTLIGIMWFLCTSSRSQVKVVYLGTASSETWLSFSLTRMDMWSIVTLLQLPFSVLR